MAVRQIKVEPFTAKENGLPGLLAKKAVVGNTLATRRAALGDINQNVNNTRRAPLHPQKPALLKKQVSLKDTKTTTTNKINVTVPLKKPVLVAKKENEKVVLKKEANEKLVKKEGNEKLVKKELKVESKEEVQKINILKDEKNDTTAVEECGQEVFGYSTKNLENVEDSDDPYQVADYVNDIYKYLRILESKYRIREGFLADKKSTPRMRCMLNSWIVEVHMNFNMVPETLYLCISLIDRYLQKAYNVGKSNLQLVGVTALLIAAKYEEMYYPDITEFVYICDNTFTREEILSMELSILKELNFNFGRPLPLHFLRRYSKISGVDIFPHSLAKYFLELSLIEYDISHVAPSLQAAAALCLSIALQKKASSPEAVWSQKLQYYSTYSYSQIHPVIVKIAKILHKSETSVHYQVIRKKFASPKNSKVSLRTELQSPIIKKLAGVP